MYDDDKINEVLTPSKEEQALRILLGKCPHNQGWSYDGHSHNSSAYTCNLCNEIKFW